ncbi:hypothetical protein BASA81_009078 [Batrachochytrium salamandrivorans]|nr:hypothetical protein BASA81_009078 [Batrachochytrium salamandrivorans]
MTINYSLKTAMGPELMNPPIQKSFRRRNSSSSDLHLQAVNCLQPLPNPAMARLAETLDMECAIHHNGLSLLMAIILLFACFE